MPKIIIYYVVSPVHLRNLELIAREMPDWTFRIVYEVTSSWLNTESMAQFPFEKAGIAASQVPETVWADNVRAVIFSTVQPRQEPINLLRSALERDIPTIAIEEVNQIALNNGWANFYLLPVDYVLVSSSYERQGMIEAGVPARRVEVTGWPFYNGQIGKITPHCSRAMKERFGLEPDRLVATLALPALGHVWETPEVRRQQLTLVAQGLPPEYQLVVKPHPIEKLETLQPFLAQCAPRAKVIEGMVPIGDVLEATDVLLNQGLSQVCIEALLREIPVIILNTGIQTPFHSLTQDLIVTEPGDFERALGKLSAEQDPMQVYIPFRKAHIPYLPSKARELTCQRIAEIATSGGHDPDRAGQWFDVALYQAWQLDRQIALELLVPNRVSHFTQPVEALRRLIQFPATRDDLETLKQYLGAGFRSYVLRCLWIDQLDRQKEGPKEADLGWMQDFPPRCNAFWFLQHVSRWVNLLLCSGHESAAVAVAQRLDKEFKHVVGMNDLVRDIKLYYAGPLGRTNYLLRQTMRQLRVMLRPIKRKLLN